MKHKYIFYYYPITSDYDGKVVMKGDFELFERVSDGKRYAVARGMKAVNLYGRVKGVYTFDYKKIY